MLDNGIIVVSKFSSTGGNTASQYISGYTTRDGAVESMSQADVSMSSRDAARLSPNALNSISNRLSDSTHAIGANDNPIADDTEKQFDKSLLTRDGVVFGELGVNYSQDQYEDTLAKVRQAESDGHTAILSVISFTHDELKDDGVVPPDMQAPESANDYRGYVDQAKLRQAISEGMNRAVDAMGYTKPVWAATIQYDTEHIHAHVVTIETDNDNEAIKKRTPVMEDSPYPMYYMENADTGEIDKVAFRDYKAKFIDGKDNNALSDVSIALAQINVTDGKAVLVNDASNTADLDKYMQTPVARKQLDDLDGYQVPILVNGDAKVVGAPMFEVAPTDDGLVLDTVKYKQHALDDNQQPIYNEYGDQGKILKHNRERIVEGIRESLELQKDNGLLLEAPTLNRLNVQSEVVDKVSQSKLWEKNLQEVYDKLPEDKTKWQYRSDDVTMVDANAAIAKLVANLMSGKYVDDNGNDLNQLVASDIDKMVADSHLNDTQAANYRQQLWQGVGDAVGQRVLANMHAISEDDLVETDVKSVVNKSSVIDLQTATQEYDAVLNNPRWVELHESKNRVDTMADFTDKVDKPDNSFGDKVNVGNVSDVLAQTYKEQRNDVYEGMVSKGVLNRITSAKGYTKAYDRLITQYTTNQEKGYVSPDSKPVLDWYTVQKNHWEKVNDAYGSIMEREKTQHDEPYSFTKALRMRGESGNSKVSDDLATDTQKKRSGLESVMAVDAYEATFYTGKSDVLKSDVTADYMEDVTTRREAFGEYQQYLLSSGQWDAYQASKIQEDLLNKERSMALNLQIASSNGVGMYPRSFKAEVFGDKFMSGIKDPTRAVVSTSAMSQTVMKAQLDDLIATTQGAYQSSHNAFVQVNNSRNYQHKDPVVVRDKETGEPVYNEDGKVETKRGNVDNQRNVAQAKMMETGFVNSRLDTYATKAKKAQVQTVQETQSVDESTSIASDTIDESVFGEDYSHLNAVDYVDDPYTDEVFDVDAEFARFADVNSMAVAPSEFDDQPTTEVLDAHSLILYLNEQDAALDVPELTPSLQTPLEEEKKKPVEKKPVLKLVEDVKPHKNLLKPADFDKLVAPLGKNKKVVSLDEKRVEKQQPNVYQTYRDDGFEM